MKFFKKAESASVPLPATASIVLPPLVQNTTFVNPEVRHFYSSIMLNPATIGCLASQSETIQSVIETLVHLSPDDYSRYLAAYYQTGLERYGTIWQYADILTVLYSCARLIKPDNYLEIGVRRGRSMSVLAAILPEIRIVGFDLWMPNYADMENPGPEFVNTEMARLGHRGTLELVGGDSHSTVKQYFQTHPNAYFDLITVDGDHTEQGAAEDLRDVIPRLKIGGGLVFDDIVSPIHPYLFDVWERVVKKDPRFKTWEFTELGYGVAVAIRQG